MATNTLFRTTVQFVTGALISSIAVLATAAPASAAPAPPITPPSHFTRCTYGDSPRAIAAGIAHDAIEQKLANMINAYRAQNGLPALRAVTGLQRIASWASVDSAFRGQSPPDHIDTLRRDPHGRANECSGYALTDYVAEINYWGWGGNYPTSEAALAWWKQSPSHNALLLDRKSTTFGVGWAYMGVHAERAHWTVAFSNH